MDKQNQESAKPPLDGQTIAVTRMREQAGSLSEPLRADGAEVIEAPTIAIADLESYHAVDRALANLAAYDWVVLTSANGAEAMFKRMEVLGYDHRVLSGVKIAVVGSATDKRLADKGVKADLVPADAVGEALADELIRSGIRTKRVLILRADIGRQYVIEALHRAGAVCDDLAIYRTVCPKSLPHSFLEPYDKGKIDWITFTSPSSFMNLMKLIPQDRQKRLADIKLASIGPVTTRAIQQAGYTETVEANPHNVVGLVSAIKAVITK
ncbi:MAG: uroporphyrinogen-III synthase [Planctomycetota bacterium]|jgi:uroporphyrinogen III methyltransferase/synthase